ncbi:MAG: phosphoglycerate kinase, partial [Bdellovibrionales bacterium]|nr:phosphoglycerate kinase [Bdellovibrionales bacterium]
MNKYLKGIPIIDEVELDGKVVFIRCDLNVPLKNGVVTNDYRIKASLPTIKYAMSQGAKVVVGSHLGRPKTEEDKKALSMEPVAEKLREFLENNVYLVEDSLSETTRGLLSGLKKGDLILLENLRFIPGETKNGPELPNAVADYADVYVNDAFGASHRAHSSIVGIPKMVKTSCVGFLMKKEIEMLSEVIASPEKPYVAILGGSKVSDKIEIIDKLIDAVDTFIIGGAMAYTFLKAQGIGVGKSLVEEDKLTFIKNFIKRKDSRGKKLLLPIDHVVAKEFS